MLASGLVLSLALPIPWQSVQGGPGGPPAAAHRLSHTVRNLQLAASYTLEWGGSGLPVEPVLALEANQGATDLNGDGDAIDAVVHTVDPQTGAVHNLALACVDEDFAGAGAGTRFAFRVTEAVQGATDLNGDGDALDMVPHVHDVATGTTTSLGLAALYGAVLGEDLAALLVPEAAQGGVDLNGDGDALDRVLHVVELPGGAITNVRLAVSVNGANASGSLVGFQVDEADQGQDLDGDGLLTHRVAHVYDHALGQTTNLQVHALVPTAVGVGHAAYRLDEAGQVDLNGDGDTLDRVVQVFEAASQTITNTAVAAVDTPLFCGGFVVFEVRESSQGGIDLNGDGDVDDRIPHAYEVATGAVQHVGFAASFKDLRPTIGRVDFRIFEIDFGDRNSDGDQDDIVLELWDLASGQVTPTGLSPGFTWIEKSIVLVAMGEPNGTGRYIAVPDSEQAASADLDGDGDAFDFAWRFYDTENDQVIDALRGVGPSALGSMGEDLALLPVSEAAWGGVDLNGDGDLFDSLLSFWDAQLDRVVDLGFSSLAPVVHGRHAIFLAWESSQGGTDFNGDGDAQDLVLMQLHVP